jgi:hypothetical protein
MKRPCTSRLLSTDVIETHHPCETGSDDASKAQAPIRQSDSIYSRCEKKTSHCLSERFGVSGRAKANGPAAPAARLPPQNPSGKHGLKDRLWHPDATPIHLYAYLVFLRRHAGKDLSQLQAK